MPFLDLYRRQVALLIRILPLVAEEESFALKGGTAINLFVRDMPRLSVDIDLTYVPVAARADSLAAIDAALKRIAERARSALPDAQVLETPLQREAAVTKLLVRLQGVQIKIEVTPVLRGCVYEPELRSVSPSVEDAFGFAEIRVTCPSPTSTAARSSPRWTASTRATSSTCATFWRMKESTTPCGAPSSFIC